MATITYTYTPNQQVWVIVLCGTADLKVKEGKIIRTIGEVLSTGTTVEYDVEFTDIVGTTRLVEADVFATLNAAVVEYEVRLT